MPSLSAEDFKHELGRYAKAADAVTVQKFFKTGKGQYGEGDVFIGVRVPDTRKVCKAFKNLTLSELQKLFDSPVHEHRLGAAFILVYQYPASDAAGKQQIFDVYLKNVRSGRINNWDIVDLSAEYVIGSHLKQGSKDLLFELAESENIWCRRVALLSSFTYIKEGDSAITLKLAERLLDDRQDLIQKALGWMLREVGKRVDCQELLGFLDKHAVYMPATALSYAIEHLSEEQRRYYRQLKHAGKRKI